MSDWKLKCVWIRLIAALKCQALYRTAGTIVFLNGFVRSYLAIAMTDAALKH